MALGPGSRIGHFQVTALLGQGGMGTVYRATDGHLGRDVAIKVLSGAFWNDPERLARFEREARTLASLSHINIAVVHGIEDGPDGTGRALVMELVDGPTLADLIAKGPIPISDALPIATQIADGLEAAHDHGIVHRDLKPANVKVRPDGTVKVLDFGLARSIDPASVSSSMSMSPTITTPAMTQAGVILGTAAYMSPEQARGKPVDRRADVWAFGCVLFEMLAGRRPFSDEDTVSDTLAGILKSDPAWAALPADTPPKIRSVLERCLRKDLRRRLPHIAEARIEIEEAASEPSAAAAAVPVVGRRTSYLWPAVAAVSLLAAAGLAARIALTPAVPQPVARFDITAPRDAVPMPGFGRTIEIGDPISPDGRTFAFLSSVKGTPMIWLRPLDSSELRPLARTEGAGRPFWSPDGRSIAFFSDGQLKAIDLRTGAPTLVCNEAGRDITWSTDDVMLIGGQNKGLIRVPASGGEPVPVTELAPGETTHDYPHFLPDNRHFFYMARRGANLEDWDVYLGSLDSKERRLFEGIHTAVRYSPTGHLLFIQGTSLMAQAFDLDRLALRGDPMTVVDGIPTGPRPLFSTSTAGTLAYLTPEVAVDSQLAWVDRTGAQTPLTPRGIYNRLFLSPDGRYAAFDRELDILLFDIERNATGSFVTRPGADVAPVFSADSGRIAFASGREPARNSSANNPTAGNLFERAVGMADADKLLWKDNAGKTPLDWSRDGYLLYTSLNDLWVLPSPSAGGGKDPMRITNTPFIENGARFSPDGRWIAFHSNDSAAGQDVYVQSFPDGGRRHPVSVNGGIVPRWSRDGKELFYVAPDLAMMAVPISAAGPDIQIGKPVRLFQSRALQGNVEYDVARDGRFLLNVPVEDYPGNSLAVIVNWTARLKK